ncbi:hypothetical protein F5Y00DRAFT_272705 [Daldinia vernicosa]|uniref:uncharacterized protein n=1 Tax=Daldinia vernicosa TaxID=114800 RepID=UPI002008503E|nr:uncharacterized protein F5Y00DRAFT_272705 [Daldinia vernicosa]KAI0845647.1 hypothetical protein F5Y00DRAFT_272705 [Daldinia vernicosa]
MNSTKATALDVLVPSTPGQLVTHEIILVHGFKTRSDDQKRLAKFKHLLENWVTVATDPIRNHVNVRTFEFDGAYVLHNGRHGLSQTTIELSQQFAVTSEDSFSPLFRRRTTEGSRNRVPRAAVFVAHGLGTWVVKDFLVLFREASNRVDPTGLVFLDAPEMPPHMTPVDVRSESAVSQYLYDLTEIYKLQALPLKIHELQEKLRVIDMNFRQLTNLRYGVCEEIKDADADRDEYTMKMWYDNVWMCSNPPLTIDSSVIKTFLRGAQSMIRFNKATKMEEQLKKLERLKLPQVLQEATTCQGVYDLQPNDIDPNTDPNASPSMSSNGKGKQKAALPSDSPGKYGILRPSNSMTPLPKISEEVEAEHRPEQAFGFRLETKANESHGDNFYDFDDAIAQRNEAVEAGDQEALSAAQSRLQLVKWHQDQNLGKNHPKVLITQREIITTSLASGMWNGKPIENWTKKDFCEIEDEMRHAFEALEEYLGPLHFETLEALVVLFSVRVSLVRNKMVSWIAVAAMLDMINDRLDHRIPLTPETMLDTLRIKYKVALTLAQISDRGDAMLGDILKDTEALLVTIGREYVADLTMLRFNILARISELRDLRDQARAAREEEGSN